LDRHCFDVGLDPNFYFYADPIPDPDWHRNDADPHADPAPCFIHEPENLKFYLIFITAMPVYNVPHLFSFSSVAQVS
jgi:hypothetical protein